MVLLYAVPLERLFPSHTPTINTIARVAKNEAMLREAEVVDVAAVDFQGGLRRPREA